MPDMNLQIIVSGLFTNPKNSLIKLDRTIAKEEPVRVALTTLAGFDRDPEVRTFAGQLLKELET